LADNVNGTVDYHGGLMMDFNRRKRSTSADVADVEAAAHFGNGAVIADDVQQ